MVLVGELGKTLAGGAACDQVHVRHPALLQNLLACNLPDVFLYDFHFGMICLVGLYNVRISLDSGENREPRPLQAKSETASPGEKIDCRGSSRFPRRGNDQ